MSAGRLQGCTAIITGGATRTGMGRATARCFAAEGANVVIGDILRDLGEEAAAEIGDSARFSYLDVSDAEDWRRCVELAEREFGAVTTLVQCAGFSRAGTVSDSDMQDYADVIAVDQTGVWLGIQAVVPSMRRAGGGSIANVSSAAGIIGLPTRGAYTAAKWEIRGIGKQAAVELASSGIRVNTILPGFIDTFMGGGGYDQREVIAETHGYSGFTVPMGRIGEPDEVARVALFLASSDSSYCTGTEIIVDGGMLAGPLPSSSEWE